MVHASRCFPSQPFNLSRKFCFSCCPFCDPYFPAQQGPLSQIALHTDNSSACAVGYTEQFVHPCDFHILWFIVTMLVGCSQGCRLFFVLSSLAFRRSHFERGVVSRCVGLLLLFYARVANDVLHRCTLLFYCTLLAVPLHAVHTGSRTNMQRRLPCAPQ